MKLSELVAEPKLSKVLLDDEATVKEFGESLEFYMYDRQDMSTYMKMATMDENNIGEMADVIMKLILDEKGEPLIKGKATLPTGVLFKVINKVVGDLGNAVSQTSTI